jgi:HEAT repeat protein
MVPDLLYALYALKEAKLNDLAYPYLSHQTKRIRLAALSVLEIDNDELLRKVISIMGDASADTFQMAQKKIETAPYQNTQLLVESLAIPNSRIRKAIFNLLESLNIKDLDVFRFARNQIRDGYQYLSDALSLKTFPENDSRNLLIDHLHQKKLQRVENILHVLALQDTSGEMKIIYRGILSSDSRKRANAMEALENMVDKRLFKEMIPLIESSSPQESLNIGKKRFQLIGLESGAKAFISHLLADTDWVTVALALDLIRNHQPEQLDSNIISEFTTSGNKYIRRTARKIIDQELEKGEQHDG